jgi:hypothetical protein
MESFAGYFPSHDLNYIGQGAKNSVFGHEQSPFVLRMAFVHDGPCVLTGDIRPTLNSLNFGGATTNLTRLLTQSVTLLRTRIRSPIDIMSTASLSDELFQSVLPPSVPGLMFGVNNAIARVQLCVYDPDIHIFNEKGTACQLHMPLRLNLEMSRRFTGSVKSMAELHAKQQPQFSGMDLLVLAFGYVHDLGLMLAYHNWFPTDAHPGNLLYNRTEGGDLSFAWHDFGRTSSESRVEAQVRTSIRQTIQLLNNCLQHPLRMAASSSPALHSMDTNLNASSVQQVIRSIRLPSPGESSHSYFSSMMSEMEAALYRVLSAEARTLFWRRTGSVSRFVVADMNLRLSGFQAELKSQRVELQSQKQRFEAELRELKARLDESLSVKSAKDEL